MTCGTFESFIVMQGGCFLRDIPCPRSENFTLTQESVTHFGSHENQHVDVSPKILRWKKHQTQREVVMVVVGVMVGVPQSGPAEQKQLGDWGHWNNTSESANVNICF